MLEEARAAIKALPDVTEGSSFFDNYEAIQPVLAALRNALLVLCAEYQSGRHQNARALLSIASAQRLSNLFKLFPKRAAVRVGLNGMSGRDARTAMQTLLRLGQCMTESKPYKPTFTRGRILPSISEARRSITSRS